MIPPSLPENAAVFLDFDGCLVELAPTPDAVVVPDRLPDLLSRLYQRQQKAVALISGRNVESLRGFLPDFPGVIAGSHGAELAFPGAEPEVLEIGGPGIADLQARAREFAAKHKGLLVEAKPHGVAIHYRQVPDLEDQVTAAMTELAKSFPDLALQPAKMALELRPKNAGKNHALARIMTLSEFAGRVPVYAGDDLTDEVAIAEAQKRGGFGIKIGEAKTCAKYCLPNPQSLFDWLDSAIRS